MSLLSIGARCASCPLVDFLPQTCQRCKQPFCANHIRSHACDAQVEAGPSRPAVKRGVRVCEAEGCERESIESIAGIVGGQGEGEGEREGIAREVRCGGCQGAFCVAHRAQTSHHCAAPLTHEALHNAFLSRQTRAREVIALHFPEQAGKVVPKPPPGRDVVRNRPKSPDKLPPSVLALRESQGGSPAAAGGSLTAATSTSTAASVTAAGPKGKSKAEKLWDLHLRKLRAGAGPLDPRSTQADANGARRFFEYAVDGSGQGARAWRDNGKWDKAERVWVGMDVPVGKVLDLIVARGKARRTDTSSDFTELFLLSLHAVPGIPGLSGPDDSSRSITLLDLAQPASTQIQEGALVVLVRGKRSEWD